MEGARVTSADWRSPDLGPAQTLAFAWWASSGEFDGLVTRYPRLGSVTRVSRKNWAELFIAG